jgi:hypothetical protein
MVTHGATYQQGAQQLGYANRSTVHQIVRQSLAAHEVASVETLREVEVRRLDGLQVGLWEAAMDEDVEAAHACLKIIFARVKGLGHPPRIRNLGSGIGIGQACTQDSTRGCQIHRPSPPELGPLTREGSPDAAPCGDRALVCLTTTRRPPAPWMNSLLL